MVLKLDISKAQICRMGIFGKNYAKDGFSYTLG